LIARSPGLIRAKLSDIEPAMRKFLEGKIEATLRTTRSAKISYDPATTTIKTTRVTGGLAQALSVLNVLTNVEKVHAFLPTVGAWVVHFSNARDGFGASDVEEYLSEALKVRALQVLSPPEDRALRGQVLEVFDGGEVSRRIRCALSDSGKSWEFESCGKPLPFEDVKRYSVKSKRDRFTRALLIEYLRKLGARPFEESFYRVDASNPALVIEQKETDPKFLAHFDPISIFDVDPKTH